jgi:hypothetical protein
LHISVSAAEVNRAAPELAIAAETDNASVEAAVISAGLHAIVPDSYSKVEETNAASAGCRVAALNFNVATRFDAKEHAQICLLAT